MTNMNPKENLPICFNISGEVIENGLANMPFSKEKKKQYPELHPSFWSTLGTIHVNDCLLVKRFSDGNDDNVYLLQDNYRMAASRFKFPSLFLSILIQRMEGYLKRLEYDDEYTWKLNGLSEITRWNDLRTNLFWNGPEAVKIQRFHMRPYISEYGTLTFRLWNEADEDEDKGASDSDENIVQCRGPVASIGVSAFKELLKALKRLMLEKPETE